MKRIELKKLAFSSILASFALISFVLEGLFPPLFIPGARMGIANIFVLLALVLLNKYYAFAVLIIKIVLGSIFTGNISAMLYSLPAGILALAFETFLSLFIKKISIVSISVCGAIINSLIQNVTFCLITNDFGYMVYMPYLAIISTVAGLIIGAVVCLIVKYLPEKFFN